MCEAEKSEDISRVFIGKQTGDSSKILLEVNAGWDVSYKSTTEHDACAPRDKETCNAIFRTTSECATRQFFYMF